VTPDLAGARLGACARQDIAEVLIDRRSAWDAEERGATFSGDVQARTRR
jgi:hypothetical protein